MRYYMCLVGSC